MPVRHFPVRQFSFACVLGLSGAALLGVMVLTTVPSRALAEDFPRPSRAKDASESGEATATASKAVTALAAWSRATPGAAKNGAVFLEIKSTAEQPDKLLSVAGAVADAIELHSHINDGGIMRMRRVDAIEIEAGQSTKLVPGGLHIMLLGLKQPLKAGETFKLKLTFETAGAIEVDVAVRANSAAYNKGSGSGTH
jgi:periplasmic copper chaperone A